MFTVLVENWLWHSLLLQHISRKASCSLVPTHFLHQHKQARRKKCEQIGKWARGNWSHGKPWDLASIPPPLSWGALSLQNTDPPIRLPTQLKPRGYHDQSQYLWLPDCLLIWQTSLQTATYQNQELKDTFVSKKNISPLGEVSWHLLASNGWRHRRHHGGPMAPAAMSDLTGAHWPDTKPPSLVRSGGQLRVQLLNIDLKRIAATTLSCVYATSISNRLLPDVFLTLQLKILFGLSQNLAILAVLYELGQSLEFHMSKEALNID